ncbi:hypothetical protein EXM22_11665 [Oceanispirochaeta crateris]|uniref:Uncharacterized protein n=1 Tax=Oceanispirochaeta crateris TaxID=2518645 RepID=A0A5C1QMQ2_9SPIO|nr:hypothetical protein [Oceanispirochaeta crateris]QEN08608.1 hypothetical protein EXM22_11665 [Oceanispirochaeta crateris]
MDTVLTILFALLPVGIIIQWLIYFSKIKPFCLKVGYISPEKRSNPKSWDEISYYISQASHPLFNWGTMGHILASLPFFIFLVFVLLLIAGVL